MNHDFNLQLNNVKKAAPVPGRQAPVFVTGIGTEIGKTLVSAIIVEALQANYWKPIQAGFEDGSDNHRVRRLITNTQSNYYDEVYKLKLPASPHIAAREENSNISIDNIVKSYQAIPPGLLVIEGAGGIMVPLNDNDFVIDLVERLNARVILVSRNYLGSINHSLVTAALCKQRKLDVAGWIFNDQYLHYEEEIAAWSGYPRIASIPFTSQVNSTFVKEQAEMIKEPLRRYLCVNDES
ncbi:MAG TPA: dethiobiotin synthase [Chitinophagaceae bacterium]|nr:dethiobiotin synthase [Chitinophagaceae bacterium]